MLTHISHGEKYHVVCNLQKPSSSDVSYMSVDLHSCTLCGKTGMRTEHDVEGHLASSEHRKRLKRWAAENPLEARRMFREEERLVQ
jgi:hypothetical protein